MTLPVRRIRAEVEGLLARPTAVARPLPVARLARELGINVVFRPFEGEEDISGFYLREKGEEVIGVNRAQSPNRQRFTIAHELGHARLEAKDGMHIDTRFVFKFRDGVSSQAVDRDEMAANAFAAQLLMPEAEIRERVLQGFDMTDDRALRDLCRHFGVSQQALMFRMMNLGLVIDGKADFS